MSQDQFVVELQKLPDDAFQNIITYLDSGKKFITQRVSNFNTSTGTKGDRGCIIGVALNLLESGWDSPNQFAIPSDCDCQIFFKFNNDNVDNPEYYRLILVEAERRGLKPKLEQIEHEVIIP